jgi:DNA-binding transcriptional regulator of glucitol operon
VLRLLRTPRWLALTALALALLAVLVQAGLWQWEAARTRGGLQNYAYAVEWWLFAAFGVYVWQRMLRDAARKEPGALPEDSSAAPATAPVAPVAPVRDDFTPAPRVAAVEEEPDEELAAYNAYLARLNARTRR